jgi:hypothetical protein
MPGFVWLDREAGLIPERKATMRACRFSVAPMDYLTQTWAIAAAEVQKLRHDPLELVTRAGVMVASVR